MKSLNNKHKIPQLTKYSTEINNSNKATKENLLQWKPLMTVIEKSVEKKCQYLKEALKWFNALRNHGVFSNYYPFYLFEHVNGVHFPWVKNLKWNGLLGMRRYVTGELGGTRVEAFPWGILYGRRWWFSRHSIVT